MKTLEDAIELAVKAHKGQTDKAGAPYILHLLRVMFGVDGLTKRTVAVLHDLLEDTSYTAEDLRKEGYDGLVIEAIVALTRLESESYEEYIKRCDEHFLAREVKMADIDDHFNYAHSGLLSDSHRIRYKKAWDYLNRSREIRRIE